MSGNESSRLTADRVRRSLRARLLTEANLTRLARLSPEAAARVDWNDARKIWRWAGPMNGQLVRQAIVRDVAAILRPGAVIETGTYRGDTTGFLADVTGAPIFTCEVLPRNFHFAHRRFDGRVGITVALEDSRSFIERLGRDPELPHSRALFYLDAHWGKDLPLADELRLIDLYWPDAVVVVDDFEVPGDPGYGFDDYGEVGSLTESYLPPQSMVGRVALYPSTPSSEETGARRGCVVLAPDELAGPLAERAALTRREVPAEGSAATTPS